MPPPPALSLTPKPHPFGACARFISGAIVTGSHGLLPHPAVPGQGLRRRADAVCPRDAGALPGRVPARPALGPGAAPAPHPLHAGAHGQRLLAAGAGCRGAGVRGHLAPGAHLLPGLRAGGAQHRPGRRVRLLPALPTLLLLGGGGRWCRGGDGGGGAAGGPGREGSGAGAEADVGQQRAPGLGHLRGALQGGAELRPRPRLRCRRPLHLRGAVGGAAALREPGLPQGGQQQPLAPRRPHLLPGHPLPL